MSWAETSPIPNRVLLTDPVGLGVATRCQCLPFQCSAKEEPGPTAQMLRAETSATPVSETVFDPVFGLATRLQCLPFQCSINGCSMPVAREKESPTAQML